MWLVAALACAVLAAPLPAEAQSAADVETAENKADAKLAKVAPAGRTGKQKGGQQ